MAEKGRPAGRVSRSDAVVAALMQSRPTVRKAGFRDAVRALAPCERLARALTGFVPDAFEVHPDLHAVTMIEVVDTHPIRPGKAEQIAWLGEVLSEHGWRLTVAVFDYCGGLTCEVPARAYHPGFTAKYAPPDCRDMTPAAMAVARDLSGTMT